MRREGDWIGKTQGETKSGKHSIGAMADLVSGIVEGIIWKMILKNIFLLLRTWDVIQDLLCVLMLAVGT